MGEQADTIHEISQQYTTEDMYRRARLLINQSGDELRTTEDRLYAASGALAILLGLIEKLHRGTA